MDPRSGTTVPTIAGLPQLRWLEIVGDASVSDGGALTLVTGKETDWFNPPPGPRMPTGLANAPVLVFEPPAGDWQLAAKVTVDHRFLFDAGTIFVHQGKDDWCKLCFEFSPEKRPTVVSVVTRGVSDDANGQIIDGGNSVHMRVSKYGAVIAFHYSVNGGTYWTLHRCFCLRDPTAAMSVGFLAQAPVGETCTATFSQISLKEVTLADPRDGS